MSQLVLIAHNLRSAHNVGSLLRTADGLGVQTVYLTGYTPHPGTDDEERLPHEVVKVTGQIQKTALGAEASVDWHHAKDPMPIFEDLKRKGYVVCALEQSGNSTPLPRFKAHDKTALVVGNEVKGLEKALLNQCEQILEIPMLGKKESFNVVQAAAMALYHLRFMT